LQLTIKNTYPRPVQVISTTVALTGSAAEAGPSANATCTQPGNATASAFPTVPANGELKCSFKLLALGSIKVSINYGPGHFVCCLL
jgi:hypothetical protein